MEIKKELKDFMEAQAKLNILIRSVQRYAALTAVLEAAAEESLDRCEVCANG